MGEEQGEDFRTPTGEREFRRRGFADFAPEVHFEPFESDGLGSEPEAAVRRDARCARGRGLRGWRRVWM